MIQIPVIAIFIVITIALIIGTFIMLSGGGDYDFGGLFILPAGIALVFLTWLIYFIIY